MTDQLHNELESVVDACFEQRVVRLDLLAEIADKIYQTGLMLG